MRVIGDPSGGYFTPGGAWGQRRGGAGFSAYCVLEYRNRVYFVVCDLGGMFHVKQWSGPAICDYEGSGYRSEFWEGRGREYEDAVERIALRRLLPSTGERIVDLGAGFGRLVDLYGGYRQVVLLDYSRSMLQEARARWGDDPRFVYVAGNLYNLPFADGAFDAAAMVRVIHHLADPSLALAEIRRILAGGGHFVLEYANKRHLKAILRYLLQRQAVNPFSREPWEFVPLNFDFHPRDIAARLAGAGFRVTAERCVSLFRLAALKRLVPTRVLAAWDRLLQGPTAPLKLGPSVFLQARALGTPTSLAAELFRCPRCHASALDRREEALVCRGCGTRWPHREGIYDFKEVDGAPPTGAVSQRQEDEGEMLDEYRL